MTPKELKKTLSSGLLSFPVTDFDTHGEFRPDTYAERLEWLAPYGASAMFAAGGTGEFFSLAPDEYTAVVQTAVDTCRGIVPIIAGTGGPTRSAIQFAQEAERLGAAGILLVYNRNVCRLQAIHLEKLAAENPNLIGFKDGLGDIELLVAVCHRLGDRLAYLCGMPTAEVYAAAYKALGVPVYSSAVFNFIPRTAVDFYEAVSNEDRETCDRLLEDFFLPFLEIRNRGAGYAVSIVKAGARIVGHDAGPVRAPLTELTDDEGQSLAALIDQLGPQ
jgi:5-dehydro-4-deoxyglucarate dehydratase